MNLGAVAKVFADRSEPAFRLTQIKRAFYVEHQDGWDKVTTLSKSLREALAAEVPWDTLTPVTTQVSKEGDTVKTLFSCADGKKIEAVLMRSEGGRNTVCISCQVGCPMGCTFCATGTMGLIRNLTPDEIVEQAVFYARWLKAQDAHVTNVVFMGMGEPMNCYDNTMKAVRLLNDHDGFNLGARHISISTCGVVPGILKLSDEPLQVNLAISLHSAINETRTRIMPVNKPYPVEKLMAAVETYAEKTNRKVFFEYLMLKGINDTPAEAEALAHVMSRNRRLFHVNLIKYHDTDAYKSTPTPERQAFMDRLERAGISVTHRRTFGEDIDAACGQLAVNESQGKLSQGIEAAKSNRIARAKTPAA